MNDNAVIATKAIESNPINMDTQEQWVELGIFKATSGNIFVKEYNDYSLNDMWNNLLPGNYRVLLNTTRDDGDIREGNLFVVHESLSAEDIPDENVSPLDTPSTAYSWHEGIYFDAVDRVIKIQDPTHYDNTISNSDLFASLLDNLAVLTANMVIFSVLNKPLDNIPKILKKENHIVAIYIENVATEINTINRQLVRACRLNDIGQVKRLLHNQELPENARLDYNNYEIFHHVCLNSHEELIRYFLTSSLFFSHDMINASEYTQANFRVMCSHNVSFICCLITELPFFRLEQITQALMDETAKVSYKHQVLQAVNSRKLYEKLDKQMQNMPNQQPENNKSVKI